MDCSAASLKLPMIFNAIVSFVIANSIAINQMLGSSDVCPVQVEDTEALT